MEEYKTCKTFFDWSFYTYISQNIGKNPYFTTIYFNNKKHLLNIN